MSSFIDLYDPLEIIGNGSFGIIRKVRRKTDGMIFARKELNFEKMSERDRKQIVAEVNILKDLNHEHIVRYIDRHVDRDAGILYILMEYCGGGDLSTVIKQAAKHNRPIPEDTIWSYFMQILLALHQCHHPNGHARSSSSGGSAVTDGAPCDGNAGGGRRVQILHRDLKPDNVFLDENNTVKLGDFGLSKALAQASFANTYVGTPYYMSPELMQEKAYDSKSDIWSLGCLIYELCALKPPFHEAKTHAELSISIRNGRIPPLPRGYSQALSNVIKAMLNLNPAMRPSAAQLLQHERLELVFKVSETEKMLMTVKVHKTATMNKERELLAREATLAEKERHLAAVLAKKDVEVGTLQKHVAQLQRAGARYSQEHLEVAVRTAVARREEELRILVMQRENEVQAAMAKREEEIAEAVRKREQRVYEAWARREAEITREVEVRIRSLEQSVDTIKKKEEDLKAEEVRLSSIREELEDKVAKWDESVKARKEKTPLEEVKNLLTPLAQVSRRAGKDRRASIDATPTPKFAFANPLPPIETPGSRAMFSDLAPSAMKGVILTSTGEMLETPTPAEFTNIFKGTPKVGLNFAKIFDFSADDIQGPDISGSESEAVSPPPSPSSRKEKERLRRVSSSASASSTSSNTGTSLSNSGPTTAQPTTRLRRSSIKGASGRTSLTRTATAPVFGTAKKTSTAKSGRKSQSARGMLPAAGLVQRSKSATTPQYDLEDEENLPSPFLRRAERELAWAADEEDLPSPFLKRVEREVAAAGVTMTVAAAAAGTVIGVNTKASSAGGSDKCPSSTGGATTATANATVTGTGTVAKKRPSNGNMLRAMAAANNVAGRRGTTPTPVNGPSSPTRASAARAAQIRADSHQHHHLPGRPPTIREGKIVVRS